MALVCIRNIKEIGNFKPFLKIGSADKDQKHAFAFMMVRKKSTNVAIRRIYSSKSDRFFVRTHFDEKKRIFSSWTNHFYAVTQDLQYTSTISEKCPVFFEEPPPPI